MSLLASFSPERANAGVGRSTALTLRLVNDAADGVVVKLEPTGDLAAHTSIQVATVYLDPGEQFDVPVSVDAPTSIAAGEHGCAVSVLAEDHDPLTARATIDVDGTAAFRAELQPPLSRSSAAGRHRVTIENTGNLALDVDISATAPPGLEIDIAAPMLHLEPGKAMSIEMRVVPTARFWRGEAHRHDFAVEVAARGPDDTNRSRLVGVYEQSPRIRPWVLPALVGAVGGLLLATIGWLAFARGDARNIAEDEAAQAIEADRQALAERIAELEAAAAEAEELPLGRPTDLRLNVSGAIGESTTESSRVSTGRIVSITDVVLQNPSGAAGRVALLRDGDVLLESQLANFRDLDFHFVAPFVFEGGSAIQLEVRCDSPGPGEATCDIGATLTGFVDEADG